MYSEKTDYKKDKQDVKKQLLLAKEEFKTVIKKIKPHELKRKSKNEGWTNREILFHMLLGFIVVDILLSLVKIFNFLPQSFSKVFAAVLNWGTPLFNFLNGIGARVGGRVMQKELILKNFEKVTTRSIKKLRLIKQKDWNRGMYYPDKWDGLFDKYMDYKKLFNYLIKHFKFHLKQIKIGK